MTEKTIDSALTREAVASGDPWAVRTVLRALLTDGATPGLLDVTDRRLWLEIVRMAARVWPAGARPGHAWLPAQTHWLVRAAALAYTAGRRHAAEPVRHAVLLDCLTSRDPALRAAAVDLLGLRGDADAFPQLEQLTTDPDDHVRTAAVRAIAQVAPERAVPALVLAIRRVDVVSGEAVNGLEHIGTAAVPLLLQELRTGHRWSRWHAAKALGAIGDPRAVAPLVDALTDEDASVRWEATYALSAIGPPVLLPLCGKLRTAPTTRWLVQGADRVLRRVARGALWREVAPLHEALIHLDAGVEVPVQAHRLERLLRARATADVRSQGGVSVLADSARPLAPRRFDHP